MPTACAASSRLALPAVLRNVFRSQFASNLGASPIIPYRRALASGPLLSSRAQLKRTFASMPHLRDLQNEQTENAAPKPSAPIDPIDATGPSEHKPTGGKRDKPRAEKSGWNSHKRQPKGQREDSERTGRSDRERRLFRNESRREAKKDPLRKAELDKAHQAKEDAAKRSNTKLESWKVQKGALKEKFPTGWSPTKKLSPDALDGIRTLHAKAPEKFTTPVLAEEFGVSPEAIRRILKSKWRPSEDEMEHRRKRWETRHDRIWGRMAELGLRPSTGRTRPVSDYHVLYDDHNRDRR
jgi:flagellar biosynthesis GTPase FlhF